jgi:malonate decarboxylase holo-[acyl-carrier-protein] synthase
LPDSDRELAINTATAGFGAVWEQVVADFVELRSPGCLKLSVNDGGARPDTSRFSRKRRGPPRCSRPALLSAAFRVAPAAWIPTLRTFNHVATRLGVEARVFGSLLTGLNYLSVSSDLEFILSRPRPRDFPALMTELDSIDNAAPMRLDGEIVRDDGAGVHWRELHSGARDVLAKTAGRPILLNSAEFIGGSI